MVIHSVEEQDGLHFITMELVQGRSLALLTSSKVLDAEGVLDIGRPLVRGGGRRPRAGVTHRDLKPANIMVTDEGRVKVLDFGLGRCGGPAEDGRDAGSADERRSTRERILGTPDYMSPEQIRGERPGPAGDVHALGVILYEMITGRPALRRRVGGRHLRGRAARPAQGTGGADPQLPGRAEPHPSSAAWPRRRTSVTPPAGELHEALAEVAASLENGAREVVHSIAVLPLSDMSADGEPTPHLRRHRRGDDHRPVAHRPSGGGLAHLLLPLPRLRRRQPRHRPRAGRALPAGGQRPAGGATACASPCS